MEKLRPFNFKIDWTEGKKHRIADTVSQSPVVTADDAEWQPDVEDDRPLMYVNAALAAAISRTTGRSSGERPPAVRCCYVAGGSNEAGTATFATSAGQDHRDERTALAAFNAVRADEEFFNEHAEQDPDCLLYTSDAADE